MVNYLANADHYLALGTNIADDEELLEQIIKGALSGPPIYRPGLYWEGKTKNAVRQLRKLGLKNFRSSKNSAITSYGDNPILNVMNFSSATPTKDSIKKLIVNSYPFNRIFRSQVELTNFRFQDYLSAVNAYFFISPRVNQLLDRYRISFDSTLGGCEAFIEFNNLKIAHVYLKLLDTLDHIDAQINLSEVNSVIEIGGGFGVNVDLQLQLFPNIRKVLYVDIAPNLYVGTQYLKSKYGASVIDFKITRDLETISFKDDESLEIYCILPSQIELVKTKFDLFHNAHSFVEMSQEAVVNYGTQVKRLLKDNGRVYFVTYDGFNEDTIHPDELLKLISTSLAMPLSMTLVPTLFPERFDYHIF
jgi:putative sugar O-methyltransferase